MVTHYEYEYFEDFQWIWSVPKFLPIQPLQSLLLSNGSE